MPNNAETVETIDAFTTRIGGIKNQRELAKLHAAETAGAKRKPFLAAIERRQSARAREIKETQRRQAVRPVSKDPVTQKRAGKPAPQNAKPIAMVPLPDTGKSLAETYFDVAGDMNLRVAFGDHKSLVRNLEPIEGITVLPKRGNLVTSADLEIDTAGLPGRLEITHAYLLDGDKPIGRCELAAPLPLDPGQKAGFRAGSLMFRA